MRTLEIPLHGRDQSIRALAIVDPIDDWVMAFRWHLTADGYAARNVGHGRGNRTILRMHRELLGLQPGDAIEVDHVNGNPLDNRRQNLRTATRGQNMQNVKARSNTTSRHRGVDFHRASGLWRARVSLPEQTLCKYFRAEEDAAEWAAATRSLHMVYAVRR